MEALIHILFKRLADQSQKEIQSMPSQSIFVEEIQAIRHGKELAVRARK